jgi:hypothetical protein
MIATTAAMSVVAGVVFAPTIECMDLVSGPTLCDGPAIPPGVLIGAILSIIALVVAWATPIERRLGDLGVVVAIAVAVSLFLGLAIASHDLKLVVQNNGWPAQCEGEVMQGGQTCTSGPWTPVRVAVGTAVLLLGAAAWGAHPKLRKLSGLATLTAVGFWVARMPVGMNLLVAGALGVCALIITFRDELPRALNFIAENPSH